jgi:hypothetical protein
MTMPGNSPRGWRWISSAGPSGHATAESKIDLKDMLTLERHAKTTNIQEERLACRRHQRHIMRETIIMVLATTYARVMRARLLHFAAWTPVIDHYEVGDYGACRHGVFHRLGNIREFGVEPLARAGACSVSLSFVSEETTVVRSAGGARVETFPAQSVAGTLELEFRGDSSILIRTGKLSETELVGVDAVAGQLLGRRDANGRAWKRGWRVIRKLYVATDPIILISTERGARFSFSGRVEALAAIEAGRGSGEVSVSSSRADSLQIASGSGPVAFDLFRVRLGGHAQLPFDVAPQLDSNREPVGEPELDDEWGDEEDDDDAELFE